MVASCSDNRSRCRPRRLVKEINAVLIGCVFPDARNIPIVDSTVSIAKNISHVIILTRNNRGGFGHYHYLSQYIFNKVHLTGNMQRKLDTDQIC